MPVLKLYTMKFSVIVMACFALVAATNAMYISSRMLGHLAVPALMAGGFYSTVGAGVLLGSSHGHHGHHGLHLDLHDHHGHHGHTDAIHVYPVEHHVPVTSHHIVTTSHSHHHDHHHGLHF